MGSLSVVVSVLCLAIHGCVAFQSVNRSWRTRNPLPHISQSQAYHPLSATREDDTSFLFEGVLPECSEFSEGSSPSDIELSNLATTAAIAAAVFFGTPPPALAATASGPVPRAVLAWLHFLGILGVSGGLITERLVLKKNMSVDEENVINAADLLYGLSALSLLISGYFRATQFEKGWEYYRNEPIFWVKMSSVAILGALSFFPAIVFFRRDMARQDGQTLPPLSDALVDRCSTIINAEILALLTIPLLASLMARGVLYTENFPWPLGAALYAISLGGAGFKYVKEAFDMMESEGALVPISDDDSLRE